MPHFDALKIYSCGKHCEKRRIFCNKQFLLFSQCFLAYMALIFFILTHYHKMPHFDALKIYSCGKHFEKRRNCLSQAISPFFTMFSTLYGTSFSFYIHFKMSSAICFNLDQSKILWSANGLSQKSSYVALTTLSKPYNISKLALTIP